jgi:hypothetical protein
VLLKKHLFTETPNKAALLTFAEVKIKKRYRSICFAALYRNTGAGLAQAV